jgi:hypothetical protein
LISKLGLDPPRAAVGNPGQHIVGRPAIIFELDHISRVQRQARRRQGKRCILAAHPFLIKCVTGFPQEFHFVLFSILP